MSLIVDKMTDHLLELMVAYHVTLMRRADRSYTLLSAEHGTPPVTRAQVHEFLTQEPQIWSILKTTFDPQFKSEIILSSFLDKKDNYQLFLTDFKQLQLHIHNVHTDHLLINYLPKDKAIDFLKNFTGAFGIHSFYLKNINRILSALMIGTPQDNKEIVQNFLQQTKSSFGELKVKIKLRSELVELFGKDSIDEFKDYWKTKSKNNTLLVEFNNYKIINYFLDTQILINDYPVANAKSKLDHQGMLDIVCKAINSHFKFKEIKPGRFNANLYMITALVPLDFNKDLSLLFAPLLTEYSKMTYIPNIAQAQYKEKLKEFINPLLLENEFNQQFPEKPQTVSRLKI